MERDLAKKVGVINTGSVVIGDTFKVTKIDWSTTEHVLLVHLKKIGAT